VCSTLLLRPNMKTQMKSPLAWLAGLALACPVMVPSSPAAETPAAPRKIVLIAGPLDPGHPRGSHEYEKSVQLLKQCLDSSPNLKGLRTETHINGWPQNPATLNDADTI